MSDSTYGLSLRLLREWLANANHRLAEKLRSHPEFAEHFKSVEIQGDVLMEDLSDYYSIVKAIDDVLGSGAEG